ncbi:uncharacterized protein BXZ73DRAFT_81541 [Epithele typhae]|uniref:uncharacterized protein n=1 Tax=Epithele typhae TaxID=378194 RepID=UPI0020082457|nr:uncharacterized protein BXZ73DRAFT_81541 [Epithele typhae]KAH9914780.1 hypothetical protein BXZ73DRAFT_81541 [Epithele typhae]
MLALRPPPHAAHTRAAKSQIQIPNKSARPAPVCCHTRAHSPVGVLGTGANGIINDVHMDTVKAPGIAELKMWGKELVNSPAGKSPPPSSPRRPPLHFTRTDGMPPQQLQGAHGRSLSPGAADFHGHPETAMQGSQQSLSGQTQTAHIFRTPQPGLSVEKPITTMASHRPAHDHRPIGQGGYGPVFFARKTDTREACAHKRMKKRTIFNMDKATGAPLGAASQWNAGLEAAASMSRCIRPGVASELLVKLPPTVELVLRDLCDRVGLRK